ncbi:MAG: DUF4300 family protein [Clostridia bacterium]|nr:DUF4300 family protein [Clostridia bacterium]
MKKNIISIGAMCAVTMLVFSGCGEATTSEKTGNTADEETQSNETEIPLTYSFLYDDATRNEIRDLIISDGVDQESADRFIEITKQFSDTLGEMKGAAEGFTTIEDASKPFYDNEYIGMTFDEKLGFDDQNCRLTAYSLSHGLYTVSEDNSFVYDDSLYGDLEILKLNKNLKFSDEDLDKYKVLFSDVPTEESADTSVHAQNVAEVWEERGITFDTDAKAQLITIMLNDPERKTIYAGHAGVLFETEEGYLLIEKLSQYTPFVAAKFTDLESLNAYLLSEVSGFGQEGASDPFVMRNDALLL